MNGLQQDRGAVDFRSGSKEGEQNPKANFDGEIFEETIKVSGRERTACWALSEGRVVSSQQRRRRPCILSSAYCDKA